MDNTKYYCNKIAEQLELLDIDGRNAKWTTTLKMFWQFLIKLNVCLPYDPTVSLVSIHSREMKIYIHAKSCTHVFIAASLFVTVKCWKQPRGPTMDE